MNDLYNVETVEQGKPRQVSMCGVDYDDAQMHVQQLIEDKVFDGWQLIDRKPTVILLRDRNFKTFAINVRHFVEAVQS